MVKSRISTTSSTSSSSIVSSSSQQKQCLITVFLRATDQATPKAKSCGATPKGKACGATCAVSGFGFTLEGEHPATLNVIAGGVAYRNGLKVNYLLVKVIPGNQAIPVIRQYSKSGNT